MRKNMLRAAAVIGFSAAFALSAYAGWTQDGDQYSYQFDSTAWARSQVAEIDGQTYGFDANAHMMTGWQQIDGKYYYFEPASGAAAKGWKQVNEKWYYLDPSTGVMKTGFYKEGVKLYYFDESGAMQTGIFYTGGFAYQAEADGSIIRNRDDRSASTGNRFIYEADGKIKFASTLTEAGNKAGGSEIYEYLTTPEQMKRWESEQRDNLGQAIEEWKDDLYNEYKKEVLSVTKAKRRANRQQKWENKVNRKLLELGATQDQINSYVSEVKSGIYNNYENYYDDYDYDESYYDDEDYDD